MSVPLLRVVVYAFTVWAVLTFNFLIPRLMPGDPLAYLYDPENPFYLPDESLRSRLAAYYGLDRPTAEQYVDYLRNVLSGNFGWSIRFNLPVGELIASRLPWTLLLTVPGLVLATAVTVVAGTEAAWRRGSLLDYALILGFTLVRTVPVFFLGVLAVLVFAVHLRLFPLSGAVTPFRIWASPLAQALDILHHWALPAAVLTVESVGARFLLMRNSVTLVLAEPYVQTARAKGLGELAIRYRHAVPNAILPLFTTFSAQLGMAVAGTVFVETIFAYPGMGLLLFQAVSARDYPVLEAGFLILSAGVLLGNLLADLAYGCLDPRVRRP